MSTFDRMSVAEIAEAVPDGALLGVPADYSGVPMAFTRALIARGARDLRLFCLPLLKVGWLSYFLRSHHLQVVLGEVVLKSGVVVWIYQVLSENNRTSFLSIVRP